MCGESRVGRITLLMPSIQSLKVVVRQHRAVGMFFLWQRLQETLRNKYRIIPSENRFQRAQDTKLSRRFIFQEDIETKHITEKTQELLWITLWKSWSFAGTIQTWCQEQLGRPESAEHQHSHSNPAELKGFCWEEWQKPLKERIIPKKTWGCYCFQRGLNQDKDLNTYKNCTSQT